MKTNRIFRPLFIALFFTCLFAACKVEINPEPKTGVLFWSKRQEIKSIKVDCYVDGKLVGTLSKVSSTEPDCSDAGSPNTTITAGKHTCEFRLPDGRSLQNDFEVAKGQCYFCELQ